MNSLNSITHFELVHQCANEEKIPIFFHKFNLCHFFSIFNVTLSELSIQIIQRFAGTNRANHSPVEKCFAMSQTLSSLTQITSQFAKKVFCYTIFKWIKQSNVPKEYIHYK